MTVITKISVQKKNTERFNIFLDRGYGEEFAFSVDQDILIKFRLKKGLVLDEEKLLDLIQEDEIKKAYNLSLKYLSFRMRSRKEIVSYLKRKNVEEHFIQQVINRLEEKQFINDLEFAKAYVRSKIFSTIVGPEKLRKELFEKGISESITDIALEEYTKALQITSAKRFSEKQAKTTKRVSNQQAKQKLYASLLRKGFTYEIIDEAMGAFDFSVNSSTEYEAISYHGQKAMRKYASYQGWEWKQRIKKYLYQRGFDLELIDQFLEERTDDTDGETI